MRLGTILRHSAVFTTLALIHDEGRGNGLIHGSAQRSCDIEEGKTYHGQLTQPLEKHANAYKARDFGKFAIERNWVPASGVSEKDRRGDCGGNCIYKGNRLKRDDEPLRKTLASSYPICDAHRIVLKDLPEHGVLVGTLVYHRGEHGDAMFNVAKGTRNSRPRRWARHFVVLSRHEGVVDHENFAKWRLVALIGPADSARELVVVDSGLFRVCHPLHSKFQIPLASFRTCAEASTIDDLSRHPRILSRFALIQQADTASLAPVLFSRLIRGDTALFTQLRGVIDSILTESGGDEDAVESGVNSGPSDRPPGRALPLHDYSKWRALIQRYGELHVDAPAWYTCASGCCSVDAV